MTRLKPGTRAVTSQRAKARSEGRSHSERAVATATAGAFRDLPRRSRGSRRRIRLLPDPAWRNKKKRTESVSPSSSSPDRPSPKRLPGGRAFNLGRSVLGALAKVVGHSIRVKHSLGCFCRKLRHSHFGSRFRAPDVRARKNAPSRFAPSSDFPTDIRRSNCLSESHQPRALRSRCTRDTRASNAPRQAPRESGSALFARFSLHVAHTCVRRRVL